MFVAGLDVGTTGCKIAVYDKDGNEKKIYYREYDAIRVEGCHELDFSNVKHAVLEILKSAANEFKLAAIGVTSFGESFVMLDSDDNVLNNAMLYTDPRGEDCCKELVDKLGMEKLVRITGVEPHQMYSIYKMMWLKANKPLEWSRCRRILLCEDYIVYVLSHNAQIDYSQSARTGAFDIKNKCWSSEVFSAAGVDSALMAKPVEPGTIAGNVTDDIKAYLGIDYDIVVVNGCQDQVAAMLGSSVTESDKVMDGTGTVECIPVIFDQVPDDMEIYKGGYSVVPFLDGKYACYAFSYTGGATLKWFRDNFAEQESAIASAENKNVYSLLDSRIPEGPTGILVLPHFAGAATPYMDLDSKAAFVGITLATTKYDIYKALMEGTSYEMKLNFEALERFIQPVSEIRATGGGAMSDVWLQIKADILNKKIVALNCKEVGAAGTAALAGYAVGIYKDLKTPIKNMVPVRKEFTPNTSKQGNNIQSKYAAIYEKYKLLYSSVRKLV